MNDDDDGGYSNAIGSGSFDFHGYFSSFTSVHLQRMLGKRVI